MVTRRGVIALAGVAALVVVAWPVGLAGWAFAAGNLLVLAAIAADWLAAEPGAIELERPEPEPLSVGRENAVRLIVRNGSSRPRRVAVGDGPPPRTRLWPTTATVELGAQDELAVDQTLVPRARGPVRFPAAEVRVEGPLGLAFRERSHPATAIEAVAIADVIQLRERNLLPSGRRIGGLRAIRAEAVGREFESLREYVRGDDYRRISWKATARRGRPVVATYRPERRQTLLLAVEAGRLMVGGGGDGLDKLDRSVNAAVMLAAIAREYDDAVGVTVFSDRLRAALPAAARPGQLRRVLDLVSPVDPELTEPDWAQGLAAASRLSQRRALVVVLSDAMYLETDARLAARLSLLARRHVVVFAAQRDAELAAMAGLDVTGGESLYQRAAAVRLIEQRSAALTALSRGGVHVLDADPDALTEQLVARFHALRSAGVL